MQLSKKMLFYGIVIGLFFVECSYAKLAPDFIHPCSDTSSACLIKAAQDALPDFVKGMPELEVPSLDPFYVDHLTIPLAGLKLTFNKGRMSGFRKCIVDNIISILEEKFFSLSFHCNLTVKGLYEAKGRILLFPINGEGDAKIKLTNLHMTVNISTDYVKDQNGRDHFDLKNYTYSYRYGDRVTFDLKNLFKESKQLSDTVLQFLNNNWRTVAEEFGKPILDYAVALTVGTISKFFIAVPYDELLNVPVPQL